VGANETEDEDLMADNEKLKHEMDSLNRLIRLDWAELESKNLSPTERMAIRRHVTLLRDELTALLLRLNELDERSTA
jgi:hypothetical protein